MPPLGGSTFAGTTSLQITQREDFGKGCYTMASEPFFFDLPACKERYSHTEDGQCVVAEEFHDSTLTTKVHVHRKRNESALVSHY